MSLSGSVSQPGNRTGDDALMFNEAKGPGPSKENPGGVFPQIDPQDLPQPGSMPGSGAPEHGGDARGVFGNPQAFNDTFSTLSSAFTTAIQAVEAEGASGVGSVGKALITRLEGMRAEIDGWRQGRNVPGAEEGEKNDEVERTGGKDTGLYKD